MGKNQKTQTSSSSSVAENNEPAESPVEQVRHTVPTTDDPTIPALTFRTWVLGVSACLIIYPSTSFFVFRQNPLFFSSTLTQIIMLPLGRLMASSLPKRIVRIPWLGFSFSLNPGPFSIKEHLLANTIAWGGYPSSLLIITSKRVFFSQDLNILPSFMMIMSTQVYNVSRVLNPETNQLDLEAYNNYSKLYQSISFVFKSGFEFAALVASIVHVALLDGRSVWQQFIQAYKDEGTAGDVHNHLMRKYKAIPSWWYYSIIVISLGLGFAICEGFGKEFQLPFWGILLACALVLVFLPPLGVILATSSKIPSTATFAELIISYLYPGRPFANMTFNIYSSMSINTAFEFLYQLKLGHYMKIPPRHMFIAQVFMDSVELPRVALLQVREARLTSERKTRAESLPLWRGCDRSDKKPSATSTTSLSPLASLPLRWLIGSRRRAPSGPPETPGFSVPTLSPGLHLVADERWQRRLGSAPPSSLKGTGGLLTVLTTEEMAARDSRRLRRWDNSLPRPPRLHSASSVNPGRTYGGARLGFALPRIWLSVLMDSGD
ncbi:hypothetical protein J5N97_014516 [Dioscorea zingiberensis]|uniref:Oligopeptide transporter n=1 Tax=Dioscorea zingiberensis TaxID=325984 RepID=A0A9D5CU35_9LILI|nr:hypothetical protein J5N97_014516 [Dioscorea zingiberensis]